MISRKCNFGRFRSRPPTEHGKEHIRTKYASMSRMDLCYAFMLMLFCCFLSAPEAYNNRLRLQLRSPRIVKSKIIVKDTPSIYDGTKVIFLRSTRLKCKEREDDGEDDPEEEDKSEEEDEILDESGDSNEGDGEVLEGDDNDNDNDDLADIESIKDNEKMEEELSPEQKAIKEAEDSLRKQLFELESTLRSERINLSKTKDKKDLSGKLNSSCLSISIVRLILYPLPAFLSIWIIHDEQVKMGFISSKLE